MNNHSNHLNHSNHIDDIDPCTGTLTDLQYLEHMIPHHQVAIDMSNLLLEKSKNPIMLHLCRDIIRKQEYEIWEMNLLVKSMSNSVVMDQRNSRQKVFTVLDKYRFNNSRASEEGCNPLFFKPDDHMAHMQHMEVNDKSYLDHMIPHHQVAVDMSYRLLLHTKHPYMIDFCNKLIVDQQGEITFMNDLLKNMNLYESEYMSNS